MRTMRGMEVEYITYEFYDIEVLKLYRCFHLYFIKEDIPKKINFKSIQKLVPVFNRKIINSMSGFRGRSLRRKQSSIYK